MTATPRPSSCRRRICIGSYVESVNVDVLALNDAVALVNETDETQGADGVKMADVNRDGYLDLVTGWEEEGRVRVYVNPGPSQATSPWPRVDIGYVPFVEDAVFVDLDGDGQMDVVSCSETYGVAEEINKDIESRRRVYVHWGPGESDYLNSSKWSTAAIGSTINVTNWMYCMPADIDGKHGIDLIVGGKVKTNDPKEPAISCIAWLEAPADFASRNLSGYKLHKLYDAKWIMNVLSVAARDRLARLQNDGFR